jgi:hypothetical protein
MNGSRQPHAADSSRPAALTARSALAVDVDIAVLCASGAVT